MILELPIPLRPSGLVILVALVILAVLLVVPGMADLAGLPLTAHARTAHNGQSWTAEAIMAAMTGGGCHPVIVYFCPDEVRYFCPDPGKPGNYLGLIVGRTEQVVITGWTARMSYWMSAAVRDGCVPAALP